MLLSRAVVSRFSLGLMMLVAGAAHSQDYPNRGIRVVAPPPGGGPEFMSRLIAPSVAAALGQSVIVDNRASPLIAIETALKAPPDGYTVLAIGNNFWIGPLLQKMSYDPVADFLPVTLMGGTPAIVVVHPSLPVKSLKEMIALAKARPGKLDCAVESPGSGSHLAAELFKSMAGIGVVNIPYKGTALAVNSLIGGEVQLMFPTSFAVAPHVKSGRLRALAVASAEPSALAPGLPTAAAAGLPGYETSTYYGIFAPAKTPAAIINRLHEEMARALKTAEVKEKLLTAGIESIASTPDGFAARVKSEVTRMGKVIREANIRLD